MNSYHVIFRASEDQTIGEIRNRIAELGHFAKNANLTIETIQVFSPEDRDEYETEVDLDDPEVESNPIDEEEADGEESS